MNSHRGPRRLLKTMLMLVFSLIASSAAAGMIASIARALGVPSGWLLALISLPPGVVLGLLFVLPLSEQLLKGGAGTRQERWTGADE